MEDSRFEGGSGRCLRVGCWNREFEGEETEGEWRAFRSGEEDA